MSKDIVSGPNHKILNLEYLGLSGVTNDMISVILNEFEQSGYGDFEIFSREIINGFSTDFLDLWFLAKLYTQKTVPLKSIQAEPAFSHTAEEEKMIIRSTFAEFDLLGGDEFPFHKGIQHLSQKLWGEFPSETIGTR